MDVDFIRQFVEKNKINAEVIEHKGHDGSTSDAAARAMGVGFDDIAKTLLFIDKNKKPAAVLCLAPNKVDWRKLERVANMKEPRLANKEEVKEILDAEVGGVPPIALPNNVEKLMDKGVLKKDVVFASAGSKFAGLKISPKDILKVSNYRVVDIVK